MKCIRMIKPLGVALLRNVIGPVLYAVLMKHFKEILIRFLKRNESDDDESV